MKSEPDVFGIDDLRRKGRERWDGVRNFMARNHMRAMALGDDVLIYHSNAKPSGVAGLARVCRTAYPDETAWDPAGKYHDPKATPANDRWSMVDVEYVETFPRFLALDELKRIRGLGEMILFRWSRLSVQPLTTAEFRIIVREGRKPPVVAKAPRRARRSAR